MYTFFLGHSVDTFVSGVILVSIFRVCVLQESGIAQTLKVKTEGPFENVGNRLPVEGVIAQQT